MNELSLLTSADTKAGKIYSDDVFSSFVYTVTGATQTINNGLDLAGKGGMVWEKRRDVSGGNHYLTYTSYGSNSWLNTNTTNATLLSLDYITSINSNGYTVGITAWSASSSIVSWTFRNAQNFYHHTVVTKTSGSNATFTFSTIATLGMVRVKRTDAAGSWYIWHRSLSAGQLLIGETTAAAATLGHITVSGNTVTLVNGVIADGTYLVEAFAHDTGVDGIIQCGSFTTDASGNATVNLGWEPQYLLTKRTDSTIGGNWDIVDQSRGLGVSTSSQLQSNLTSSESNGQTNHKIISTGFIYIGNPSATYIYLAIRRQNKPPTIGTQVYNAIARTGTDVATTLTGVGFIPDLYWCFARGTVGTTAKSVHDRMRSDYYFISYGSGAEVAAGVNNFRTFDMDGITLGPNAQYNYSLNSYANYFFKRAPGVLDQICYTGTGTNKTEFHNLTVTPELWLIKSRSATTQWVWGSTLLSNTEKINMPTVTGRITDTTSWNSTNPTSTTISLGTSTDVNASAATYVAYLWASKVGISKVFSYIGNGTSHVINCGFTTGARYIMIIRTNSGVTQDIFVFDSVRGILSSNDPHLSMNTTAAEVTTDDSVDPDLMGFSINQNAATNINVLNATYIGLAYA